MHFTFTEEQALLQESIEKFVENEYPFEARRDASASDLGFSAERWAKFAELGWLGLGISEAHGGYGGGAVETAVVLEGLGRALAVEPYIASVVMSSALIGPHGTQEQAKLLAQVASGQSRIAFALAERHSGYDLHRVQTTASAVDDGYRLDGHKSVVVNGDSADYLIVSARTGNAPDERDGVSLFLIEAQAEGVERRGYPTVDGLRAAEIALDGVLVPTSALVGAPGAGVEALESAVDAGTVALCAEAVGIMKTMYTSTLDYMREREQFGQTLASFQALQHRVVDMFVEYELSRSMAYMAAVKLTAPREERRRAVAAAKVQIGKSAKRVGEEAIQLHGGMGMTDEMAISHYFKRLTMINTTFGDVDHHMDYLVRTMATA